VSKKKRRKSERPQHQKGMVGSQRSQLDKAFHVYNNKQARRQAEEQDAIEGLGVIG